MGCLWGEAASVGTARRMPHLGAGAGTGQALRHPYQDAASLRRGFLERGENNPKNLSVPSLNPREEKPPGVPLPLRLPQRWWRRGPGQLPRDRNARRARGRALASLSQALLSRPPGPAPPPSFWSLPSPPSSACLPGILISAYKGRRKLTQLFKKLPWKKRRRT